MTSAVNSPAPLADEKRSFGVTKVYPLHPQAKLVLVVVSYDGDYSV